MVTWNKNIFKNGHVHVYINTQASTLYNHVPEHWHVLIAFLVCQTSYSKPMLTPNEFFTNHPDLLNVSKILWNVSQLTVKLTVTWPVALV